MEDLDVLPPTITVEHAGDLLGLSRSLMDVMYVTVTCYEISDSEAEPSMSMQRLQRTMPRERCGKRTSRTTSRCSGSAATRTRHKRHGH